MAKDNTKVTDKTNINKKKLLDCLEKSLGVVTTACKKANISRTQHYEWLNEDHHYAKAVDDIQEMVLDFTESQLYSQVAGGNTVAILFLLKTKGKKRGYIERNEITGADGERIDFNIQVIQGDKSLPFQPD